MPRKAITLQYDIAENCYHTKCGLVKVINDDRTDTLKLWFRLHKKKCKICKDLPYNNNGTFHYETNTVEDMKAFGKKFEPLTSNDPSAKLISKIRE